MVICIPCAVGLSVLASPILHASLWSKRSSTAVSALLLQTGSHLRCAVYGMSTLTNGILQGMDKMRLPVIHAAISLATPCGAAGSAGDGTESEHSCSGLGKYFLCIPDVRTELQIYRKIYALSAGSTNGPFLFLSWHLP